jgi:hypothetical protein
MKKALVMLTFILLFSSPVAVHAGQSRGVVVFEDGNIAVIAYQYLYCGVELYGDLTNEGTVVIGDFNLYGFQDIYDLSADQSISVYIDEIIMSEDEAEKWIMENIS